MIELFFTVDDFDIREFKGCSETEINMLMAMHGFNGKVPASFKDFLLWGGHRIADMRPLSQFFYKSMVNIKKDIDGGFMKYFPVLKAQQLPHDALIYCGSEGYYFEFIDLSKSQDPTVYSFDDDPDTKTFTEEDSSFAHRLQMYVDDYLTMHRERIDGKDLLRIRINDFKKCLFDAIQYLEEMQGKYIDEWLDNVLNWYYRARRDVYDLYDDEERKVKNELDYAINNVKRIDLINFNSVDKTHLQELNEKLIDRFKII